MKMFNSKTIKNLPNRPALVRETNHSYAIWAGRIWHGSIDRMTHGWRVTTPGSVPEMFTTFQVAKDAAESRAIRAERT